MSDLRYSFDLRALTIPNAVVRCQMNMCLCALCTNSPPPHPCTLLIPPGAVKGLVDVVKGALNEKGAPRSLPCPTHCSNPSNQTNPNPGAVKGLVDVVKGAQKEKVVRVGLLALKNLAEQEELVSHLLGRFKVAAYLAPGGAGRLTTCAYPCTHPCTHSHTHAHRAWPQTWWRLAYPRWCSRGACRCAANYHT